MPLKVGAYYRISRRLQESFDWEKHAHLLRYVAVHSPFLLEFENMCPACRPIVSVRVYGSGNKLGLVYFPESDVAPVYSPLT